MSAPMFAPSAGERCPRCHDTAPNANGCATCNPEKLGERLGAALAKLAAAEEEYAGEVEERIATAKVLCRGVEPDEGGFEGVATTAQAEWIVGKLAALEASHARLARALVLSKVDQASDRTWCHICRTEFWGDNCSRENHPHADDCLLADARKVVGK
jgi:hypothetical protein